MKKWQKRLIIGVVLVIVLLVTVVPIGITHAIYNSAFGKRFESGNGYKYDVSEFKNLKREPISFLSNKGQKLSAYIYENSEIKNTKGLIVLAHGMGAGHISYMAEIAYLAQNGYKVFAYDATACDESEGKAVGALLQGPVDLDYALKFIEGNDKLKGLKLMLYGHSWGGYSAMTVLNYDHNLKGVVEVSGFNSSKDMVVYIGSQQAGDKMKKLSPYLGLYEKFKYGKVANLTALDGLKKTTAKVMLIQSKDDDVVLYKDNFKVYEDNLKGKENMTFIMVDKHGHNAMDSIEYTEKTKNKKEELVSKYGSIKKAPEDAVAAYNELQHKPLEKLDKELMNRVVEFYDKVIQGS